MSGGFNFQVNDGVNFTPRQIFSITARTLVLSLERNRPLRVFPGKCESEGVCVLDQLDPGSIDGGVELGGEDERGKGTVTRHVPR